jgi:hypothetical protein
MNDPISALTDALADRYRIERELGQGGRPGNARWRST